MNFQIVINEKDRMEEIQRLIKKGVEKAPADVVNQINALYMNIDMLFKRFSANIETMFTAWEGDRCIGALSVMKTQTLDTGNVICSLLFVYVEPEYRDNKVASELMNRAVDYCREHKIYKLNMSARFEEKRQSCLGINHGFKPEGYLSVDNEKYDTVVMGLRL